MKYVVFDSFFNFDKRGNSKPIPVNTQLSQKEYDALTPAKKAKCLPKNETEFGRGWTDGQYKAVATVYHFETTAGQPPNANDLVNLLHDMGVTRDGQSLACALRSCVALDSTMADVDRGLHDHAAGLLSALVDLDEDRYRDPR